MNHLPKELIQELYPYLTRYDMGLFQTCKSLYDLQPLTQICVTVRNSNDVNHLPLTCYRICIDLQSDTFNGSDCVVDPIHAMLNDKMKMATWKEMKINQSVWSKYLSGHLMRVECKTMYMFDERPCLKIIHAKDIDFRANFYYNFDYLKIKNWFSYPSFIMFTKVLEHENKSYVNFFSDYGSHTYSESR